MGWRYLRHEYVNPEGKRTVITHQGGWDSDNRIRGGSLAAAQKTVRFPRETFFVGTKDQLQKSWEKRPDVRDHM